MKLLGNTAGECAGNFRSGDILQTGKIQLRELLEKTAIFFYSFNKVFRFFLMKFHFTFFSNKISF